jgi:hypothetical protein
MIQEEQQEQKQHLPCENVINIVENDNTLDDELMLSLRVMVFPMSVSTKICMTP